jgi:hypothetical protein
MSDALIVTAPVPGRYPTVNSLGSDGFRGGKKSIEYHDLFTAVKDNAESEMLRTGWTMATYYCAVSATLYRNTKRKIDAGNLLKCEADALTAAGVWADDYLARPNTLDVEYDPNGESRVVIIIRRRFPDAFDAPKVERLRPSRPKGPIAVEQFDKPVTREPMGEINGVPVPRSQILADLKSKGYR